MELTIPSELYYPSYVEATKEYHDHHVNTYIFLATTSCKDLLEQVENFRTGENLPDGYVKDTYLWLVDHKTFLGEVSIRHTLTDSLSRFGGNIGYGIRYSEWNKGKGTIMLSKALIYAKEIIGLDKVLLTCNDDNYSSQRIIEKNGGQLQDTITNTINGLPRQTRRYWIHL